MLPLLRLRLFKGNLYTVRVSYEYFEQAVTEASTSTETVESSSYFKSVYDSLDTSAEVSGEYGGFSGSIQAEYATVTESAISSSSYRETTSEKATAFVEEGEELTHLQIIEVKKVAVTINGRTAKTDTRTYEDSVKVEDAVLL